MSKPLVSTKDAVEVLNRALASDPEAVRELFNYRTPCNENISDDPTIQVRMEADESYTIGMIGILNGIFGVQGNGNGYIAASHDLECPAGGKLDEHLSKEECSGLRPEDLCPKCNVEIQLGPLLSFMEME